MKILFGMALDDQPLPPLPGTQGGVYQLGPRGLLQFLEGQLGLSGHPKDNEYLRVEQYRQALRRYLSNHPATFFARSFTADQFGTASNLLQRRDELLLGGWDLEGSASCPPRLSAIAEVEQYFRRGELSLAAGFADRLYAIRQLLPHRPAGLEAVEHVEPLRLLPPYWQAFLKQLQQLGIQVSAVPEAPEPDSDTDLAQFQRALRGGGRFTLKGDGSLLLLKGRRDGAMAAYLAQLLRLNPGYRPALLVHDNCQALGHALRSEGLPALGMPSASLARPTLQVLKLATVFLWQPLDPFKLMEFVSLAVKPLEQELSNRIADHMSQMPGLDSDSWKRMIAQYFDEMEERAAYDDRIDLNRIRDQYRFWFRRQRYDISGRVPREEAVSVFNYLQNWAKECFDENEKKNSSLLVLQEQARRIRELLLALPEEDLTHLELERVVRTIYEPAPVQLEEREQGALDYTSRAGAICGPVSSLVWWDFTQSEAEHFFSRWYQPETAYLKEQGIMLQGPEAENQLQLWQRQQPILRTTQRLLLVIPQYVNGQERNPHPLMGDLEAKCKNLGQATLDMDTGQGKTAFEPHLSLPGYEQLPARQLGRPQPFIQIRRYLNRLQAREQESFSSLRDLFYYPYQWVFRHKVRLRQPALLSIVKDHTLFGNLAHRFFERLLEQEEVHRWTQDQVEAFIDSEQADLLQKEGAVLLLYGREPERTAFLQKVKLSAWSLIRHMQENGWQVEATEASLEGELFGLKIVGRADLLLRRGEERAVLDLKWRGRRRREELIRNEEDLQLVIYAKMAGHGQGWAHTAFYIMEEGQLVARNNYAFQSVIGVAPDADAVDVNQRVLQRMAATYEWRMQQIVRGQIEVRCTQTQPDLEEAYTDAPLLDLLEMKTEDAPFDDYRALIKLLE